MNIIEIIENNVVPYIRQPVWENWYIKERIGSGSFSVVYRIEADRINSTDVSAMKIEVITTDGHIFTDISIKRQFLESRRNVFDNEVRIMKQLRDCPFIVRYEDEHIQELFINGNFEGYYCLIRMEYLSSVYNLMRNGQFDYSEQNVRKLALNIGQGLKAAHDINVIHRDIKPDNLFVSEKGIYKLGDFNISKRADNTRSFAGSQLYMAPEVYRSKSNSDNSYTKQADIYSFGLCLYQMMNDGILPFEENLYSEEAFQKRMNGIPIPPPKNASAEFGRIILKACAFDINERYKSVDEILTELMEKKSDTNVFGTQYVENNTA
ncbi:MAG: serine/threonine-protein kinase [Ruminococcus sp.]|nr:serine/threonine-protein kinase [Ruminococcus sp.]